VGGVGGGCWGIPRENAQDKFVDRYPTSTQMGFDGGEKHTIEGGGVGVNGEGGGPLWTMVSGVPSEEKKTNESPQRAVFMGLRLWQGKWGENWRPKTREGRVPDSVYIASSTAGRSWLKVGWE